jgi:O-antigen/teichoic acid export membrane protein
MGSIMFLPLTVTYLRQWAAIPLIGTRRAVMPEQTILPLMFSASILLPAVMGWKVGALSVAMTYAGMMTVVWVVSLMSNPLRDVYRAAWRERGNFNRRTVCRQMRDGLPFVSVALGGVLSQACMPLVIAATCGFVESGLFALAMPYAALAAVPLGIFNLSMIPRCARHFKNGEFAEANHAVRSAATATFVLAAFISFLIWQFSPLLIRMLGEEYSAVCRLFPPLLLAAIVDCLTGPTIPVMQTMKMEVSYTRSLFAYIPVQLGLIYLFGSFAGIEGAAIAYLLARCLWNTVVLIRIYQVRGLIMLPYLRVSEAIHEWSTVAEKVIRLPESQQRGWNLSPALERTAEPVRAA